MEYSDSYQNGGRRDADFQKLAQNIGSNIQKILQNVSSMQRMIAQIGTPQDNQQLQTQLHQIQHYTGQLAKDTSTHLHDLSNGVSTLSQSEQRQWRLQKERLHNDFTKALNGFQAAQRTAAQKEKDVIKRARGAQAGGLAGPNQGRNLIDIEEGQGGQGQSQEEQQRRQQMLIQEEYDMEQLQERERSIRQLESDILDVNTIFKDLATLVHDQGEMIDSIEANVESTHVRVQEGTEHLRQAETYKNKARKKKLILALIGLIILGIIIGIIAWQAN